MSAAELSRAAETLRRAPLVYVTDTAVAAVLADWLQHEAVIGAEDEADGHTIGPRYPGLVLARLINGVSS